MFQQIEFILILKVSPRILAVLFGRIFHIYKGIYRYLLGTYIFFGNFDDFQSCVVGAL